jgi:phage gp36-like protein
MNTQKLLVLPEKDQELNQIESKCSRILKKAQKIEVMDDKTVEDASTGLKVVRDLKKTIEEKRKFFVKPLNDHVKRINEFFKTFSFPLDQADRILKKKILDYQQLKRKQMEKEKERLQKKIKKAEESKTGVLSLRLKQKQEEIEKELTSRTVKYDSGVKTITRKKWTFEIVDISKIPREYLMVDTVKINQAIKQGVREIPGVKIYQKEEIVMG